MEVNYVFMASASTGFGETGIFAAIGDPFNLSGGGGSFTLQVGDPVGPGTGSNIPEPSTLALLGLSLFLISSPRAEDSAPQERFAKSWLVTLGQPSQQAMTPMDLSDISDLLGYAAAGLVLVTFSVRSLNALRSAAIASNLMFIAYAATADLMPVLILHALLLPLNVWRLRQDFTSTQGTREPLLKQGSHAWYSSIQSRLL